MNVANSGVQLKWGFNCTPLVVYAHNPIQLKHPPIQLKHPLQLYRVLLYQLENRLKNLPTYRPDYSSFLQGEDRSYSVEAPSYTVEAIREHFLLIYLHTSSGVTVIHARLISRCHWKSQNGAVWS